MSAFTWLDYSEFERKQAMEVIDLFREEDTRDELGLGSIRDAFSDLLFPGTSTIQTRARYFLFVPWVCREIERKRFPSREAAYRCRLMQGRLRDGLTEGGEDVGVIGYRAGLHVQRLPSSVYWYGLRAWGILRFDGTEEDYYRYLDHYYRRLDSLAPADAGESQGAPPANWDAYLPPAPARFPSEVTFELTAGEAEYLIDRIVTRSPRSLLAHLLLNRQAIADQQDFPWDACESSDLDAELSDRLAHARNFSEVLHGAALLYNLLLAEQKPGRAFTETYRERLGLWRDGLRARSAELNEWDRAAFWNAVSRLGARVSGMTRQFVDAWVRLALAPGSLPSLIDGANARRLVVERERWLKRGRARIGNPRALENWQGASGSAQLDYRWNRPIRAIVNDLLMPLTGGTAHA